MKLNPAFLLQQIGDETVLVPTGGAPDSFHGIGRLNETAAFIANHLQAETSVAAVADALCAEYEVDYATAVAQTERICAQLRSIGALLP